MKRATAVRTGPTSYRVAFGKQVRECRYAFLLALAQAGYRVRLEQDGWGRERPKILRPAG